MKQLKRAEWDSLLCRWKHNQPRNSSDWFASVSPFCGMLGKVAFPWPLLAAGYPVGIQLPDGAHGGGGSPAQGGGACREEQGPWPGHLSPQSLKYAEAEKPTRRGRVAKRQRPAAAPSPVWPHTPACGQGSTGHQFQPNRASLSAA